LQRENKQSQFRSVVFTRTYFDPSGGPVIEVPVYEQAALQLAGGEQYGYPQARTERRPGGRIRSVAVDAFQVDISDRANTIEESPDLKFQEIAWKFDMQEKYGIEKIPKGQQQDFQMVDGLAFKRQLEVAIPNTGEPDAESAGLHGPSVYADPTQITDDLTCRHERHYIDLRVYKNYIIERGDMIPFTGKRATERVKMGEVFDEGLVVCKLNGEPVASETIDTGSGTPTSTWSMRRAFTAWAARTSRRSRNGPTSFQASSQARRFMRARELPPPTRASLKTETP
jgi:hypothetical protein